MTHPGIPRDVDLHEWLRSVGFHPADTRLKQLGHETARALVAQLGVQLHYFVPPGADKSVAFRKLREVMFYANAQLATAGGPAVESVSEGSLRGMLEDLLGDAARPADPRLDDYKEQQLAGAQVVRDGGFVIPDSRKDALALLRLYTEAVRERHPDAPEFDVPDDVDAASDWLDRANDAVNARHPGTGYTPGPVPDDGSLERALVGALRVALGDNYEITSRDYRTAASILARTLRGALDGYAPSPRDLEPDETAPRGYWRDGAARRPIPLNDGDLDNRHSGYANTAGAVVYDGNGAWGWWPAAMGAPPASDGTTPGYVSRLKLTPAAAEVTAPTEPGGVADRAPVLDEGGHTIWGMNPTRESDDVDLGVTLVPGGVGLAMLAGPRAPFAPAPAEGVVHGFTLRSLDAVNMVLETIAAAAGRAFSQE